MKKKYVFIILILIILLSFIIYPKIKLKQSNVFTLDDNFSREEINYILDNNIDLENLNLYMKYKYFDLYNYNSYELIRTTQELTHLESINSFRHINYFKPYVNPLPALFLDTNLVLVNKSYYLSKDFIPSNLVSVMDYEIEYTNADIMLKKEVLDNYQKMYLDALKDNISFAIFSGFRSYKRQEHLFYNVYNDDTISAKPGHSEHQTGYAIDISPFDVGLINELENTPTYKWLINNCYKYGFILRFPKNKTEITTYQFEPWHFRYVGDTAYEIMANDLTLEEYIFSNLEI